MRTWTAAVEALVARFDVAAKFGANATHNGEGAAAIARLLREMADRLDYVATHYQPIPGHEPYKSS